MLTHIAAVWHPRLTHAIARILGIGAALREFCPHCPCGAWDEDEDEAAA